MKAVIDRWLQSNQNKKLLQILEYKEKVTTFAVP